MGFLSKLFKAITKPLRTVLGWLMPTPDQPPAKAVMVEKQGSDNPIPIVYGTRKIGGIKVHKYVTDASGGAENEFLHLIVPLCEGPIDSIVDVFFDGVSENDAKWLKPGGGKWFTVSRYLGEHDQPASASAVSQIPNWTIDHRLCGIAYLYIRVQMDKEQSIWRGEPAITATVRGRKILDPRTGQTAYSENPPLQLLDYLTNTVYGKGLPLARLNQPSFLQAADLADQQLISDVTTNEITTELYHRRFTSNAVLDSGASVFNNVKKLLSGMRGLLPIGSGFIRLAIETSGAPVFHFSHGRSEATNHATITGPVKTKSGRKGDRYNRVIVRFPNKNTEFENDEIFYPTDANPLAQQWLDEDNGIRLEQSFEFETITSKAEAYQMAEIIAKRSRNRLECSFPASPAAIQVEPGDIVSVTDDTRGWDAKPFRVEQVKLEDDGDCDIELIEHQNAIYPWSGTSYSERVGGTNLGDPANIPAPTGLSITPDQTFATAGRLTWSTANNAFIRRFKITINLLTEKIYSVETQANSIDLPRLDVGEYTISLYAVSTIDTLSPPAVLMFSIAIPIPPTNIQLIATYDSIEASAVLAGRSLATTFTYDIAEGDGAGYTPADRITAGTAVFVGLKPETLYTVFARTVNVLGASDWISRPVETPDSSAFVDLLKDELAVSIFPEIVTELRESVLANLPTNEQVDALMQAAIGDPRIDYNRTLLRVVEEYGFHATVENLQYTIANETEARAASILQLNANDVALLQQINTVSSKADGTAESLAAIITAIEGEDGETSAELILQSLRNDVGELYSRAYLGVTVDVNGVAKVNGLVIDGQTNTFEISSDKFRLSNTEGEAQLFYNTETEKWVFRGELIAELFKTANTGYRAEMGAGDYPFWYGTGTKNLENALFATDMAGTITMRNANVQGKIVTNEGTGIRVEVGNDGDYLIWAGEGAKTDQNALFFIKANAQGFIKNDFFVGQIIESRSGAGTTTATAAGHQSDGKPVKVEVSASFNGYADGNHENSRFVFNITIYRDGTALGSFVLSAEFPFYDALNDRTGVFISGSHFVLDTRTEAETRNYSASIALDFPPAGFPSINQQLYIITTENKLAS